MEALCRILKKHNINQKQIPKDIVEVTPETTTKTTEASERHNFKSDRTSKVSIVFNKVVSRGRFLRLLNRFSDRESFTS